jgi:type IV pilus assembly protein PilO
MGLVLVGAASYIFILAPVHSRTIALEARRVALRGELGEAHAQLVELNRYRREKVESQNRLDQMAERLSPTRAIPPLFQIVQEAAIQADLALTLFRPREPRRQTYYTEMPITVTAQGTYHRLGHFLARIADLPRVVTIDELRITAIEHPEASLRAEMILTTYVYRPLDEREPPRPIGSTGADKKGASPSP